MRPVESHHLQLKDRYGPDGEAGTGAQSHRQARGMLEVNEHPFSAILNWASALSVVGTLLGVLPSIAAGLAIIWYCVLLYDRFFAKTRRFQK
jgi:hypothetical protein